MSCHVFLQEGRKYEITLNVPFYLGDAMQVAKPNPHLHLLEVRTNGGMFDLSFFFSSIPSLIFISAKC